MTTLVIRGGHLIDPSAGVTRSKTFCSRTAAWPRSPRRQAQVCQRRRSAGMQPASRRARPRRHTRPPARAGQGYKETIATARLPLPRAALPQWRHAQHKAGERFAGDHALDAGARTRRGWRVFPIAAATRVQKATLNDYAALKSAELLRERRRLAILKDSVMRETLAAAARVG